MKQFLRHIRQILCSCVVLYSVVACHTDEYREECDYNVLLRHDYNEENAAHGKNMIEYYIHCIDEYIFDEAGILFDHRRITTDICREMFNSEWHLPPGRYSVIAIANRDERSVVSDTKTGTLPQKGVTHREDMRLSLEQAEVFTRIGETVCGDSEKLYYAYKTFTVQERGISRVRVNMVNAHLSLKFRVTWKNKGTPPTGNDYHVLLESVPSEYRAMPEYFYPAESFECLAHDCHTHDLYPANCNEVIHHIPYTCHQQKNVRIHRSNTAVTVDKEMWGEYISYRIKADTKPVLHIYRNDGTPIRENIQLYRYFEYYGIKLNSTLKQAYRIDIVIDGDQVILVPLKVADYEEGGVITGAPK